MKKNHLTIIFMKDTSQPLTYEISIKLIVFVLVLLVGSASTYAFFVKGYYSLYRDNQKLERIIRSLKTEISTLQSAISRFNKERLTEELEGEEPVRTGLEQDTLKSADVVALQELKLKMDRDANNLSFSFILDKIVDDGQLIRGYVFVALKNSRTNQKLTSFPEVNYNEGKPIDYLLGDRFAIRRFKGYRGELKLVKEADMFEILVYSDTGKSLSQLRRNLSSIE